jgi:peptide-methionine (S)-S-oxide reductase
MEMMVSMRATNKSVITAIVAFLSMGVFQQKDIKMEKNETAVLGAGCFWCTEAVFERLDGVKSVMPGYAGGSKPNPTYEEVCTGKTGYAEVAEITFDPSKISYENLLKVFWECHDPTTLNRQGADEGTQYRSVIFFTDEGQRSVAEKSMAAAQKIFKDPIVTQVVPLTRFYRAEDYHQKYYENNANAPYCRIIIKPKLDKLKLK